MNFPSAPTRSQILCRAKSVLFIGALWIFGACVFDSKSTDLPSGPVSTVDTVTLQSQATLLDSGESFWVQPISGGDSLSGFLVRTVRSIVDSQLAEVTTHSLAGLDSTDTVYYSRSDTLYRVDTLGSVQLSAIRVTDTVVTQRTHTDSSLYTAPDTGLILARTHLSETTLTHTWTGKTTVAGAERTVRHFLDTSWSRDSASVDSLSFFAVDSVLDSLPDTSSTETVLDEQLYRRGGEDLIVRNMRRVRTSRIVDLYHFRHVSSKWEQDAEGNWIQVADTAAAAYAAPLSIARDTLVYQDTVRLSPRLILATVSDYKTGSYSAVTLEGRVIQNKVAPIHSDAFARHFGGDNFYVVNRLGRDNVQIVNRNTLKTVGQFALPAGGNPQNLLHENGRLYAVLFGSNSVEVHDAETGAFLESIAFDAYADTGDGVAEAGPSLIHQGKLFVALGRLQQNAGWVPLPTVMLRVDLLTKAIDTLALPFTNPNSVFLDGDSLLVVAANAGFGDPAGGMFRVDPVTFRIRDTLLTEKTLGGDLSGALWAGSKYVVQKSTFADETLQELDPTDGSLRQFASSNPWSLTAMTYDTVGSTLYVGDRVSGLRMFSVPGFEEKASSGIQLGLPPISLAVIR